MKSFTAVLAAGATMLVTGASAGTLLSHIPVPGTTFSHALNAQDLAIEAVLNTGPDQQKASAKKLDAKAKAFGTLFGASRNNAGAPICGLVRANGAFMFSWG